MNDNNGLTDPNEPNAQTPTEPGAAAPARNQVAEEWKQWEAEDTGKAGKARSKGSIVALLAVLALLVAAIVYSVLRQDSPLPPTWERPADVEILDSHVVAGDDNMLEYYLLRWPGDPQAVLSEAIAMTEGDSAVRLTDGRVGAAIDGEVLKHREQDAPGRDITLPEGASDGLAYTHADQAEPVGPAAQPVQPRPDIYVWRQNGYCLVEIFSYSR
jgi:hypothetical protein